MEYLKQKLYQFANVFITRVKESNKEREVRRYEVYFEYFYKVLSWENTTLSLVVFLILNFLFWVIVQWQLKFFGVVFFSILLGFLWDAYFESKHYPDYQGQYLEAVDEIWCFLSDVTFNLKALRKESPSSFCLGMSLTFLFMSFIARSVSGYILLYFTILGVFFIPLGLKYLPEEYVISIKHMFKSMGTSKDMLAEEELLPFISNKDFNTKDTDLDSLLTDRTADSATNSLVSGISAMPSYLDVAESRDGIEEDDLIPKNSMTGVSYTPGELSSDSDSDHREIHFDSAHFKGDSSSEEEDQLIKGLRFSSDINDIPQKNTNTQDVGFSGVLSNIATMGTTLVAHAIKSVSNAPAERKNSSSDSEFEIINSDEVESS